MSQKLLLKKCHSSTCLKIQPLTQGNSHLGGQLCHLSAYLKPVVHLPFKGEWGPVYSNMLCGDHSCHSPGGAFCSILWMSISRLIRIRNSIYAIFSKVERTCFHFRLWDWRKEWMAWQRQQRRMRGTQSGRNCEKCHPDETGSVTGRGICSFISSGCLAPYVYLTATLRCFLGLSRRRSSPWFCWARRHSQ